MDYLRPYPDLLTANAATQRLMMCLPWEAADPESEVGAALASLVRFQLFEDDDFGASPRALGLVAADCAALRSPRPAFFGRHCGESAPEVLADAAIDACVLCANCPELYELVAPFLAVRGPSPAKLAVLSFKPTDPLPLWRPCRTPESETLWESLEERGKEMVTAGHLPLDELRSALAEALRGDRVVLLREIMFELRAVARARVDATDVEKPPMASAVVTQASAPPPQRAQYLFAQKGNNYHLRFEEEETKIRALKGLQVVEFLLKQPRCRADVLEIEAALAEDRPLRTIGEEEALASTASEGESRWNEYSRGATLTESARDEDIARVEGTMRRYEEESAEAELHGDVKRAKELSDKALKGRQWLSEQRGLRRKAKTGRGVNCRKEAARQRIKNNLENAREHLRGKEMFRLAQHLEDQIQPDSYGYKYQRIEGVEWVFEEPQQ